MNTTQHHSTNASKTGNSHNLRWRQRIGLAIVGAGTLIQWAAISHHLAAA